MKKIFKKLSLSGGVLLLAACSTITTGTTQPFAVNTPDADGAKCVLTDSKQANWIVNATPGIVEVQKGDGPMTVQCTKKGFKSTSVVVEEGLAGMTFGNVLLGGGIGVIVDAASGAAQEYPDAVHVWMEPEAFATSDDKTAWLAKKEAFEQAQADLKSGSKDDENKPAGNN